MHFQGEQHGKGPVDRLFGWGCAWIEDFLQKQPIHGLRDLVQCYRSGAQYMVNSDPTGPKFHIEAFDPGELRPETRTFFQRPGFLITRTYCLHTDFVPGYAHGIRLKNKLFSDSEGAVLHGWFIGTRNQAAPADEEPDIADNNADGDDSAPDPKKWRRGFWNSEKTWEGSGPKPGQINEIVRRHGSQKSAPPPVLRPFRSEVEKALSAAALRLRNAAAKKRRQTACLRQAASDSSSSSDASNSSDSDSSAS